MSTPLGEVVLNDRVVCVPRPSAAIIWSIATESEPVGGPDETTSATSEPTTTCVPATGFWLITEPAGTVVLDDVVIVPTVRLAAVIAFVAAACVIDTTFGT